MITKDEKQMYEIYKEKTRRDKMIKFIYESLKMNPWIIEEGGIPQQPQVQDPLMIQPSDAQNMTPTENEEELMQPIIDQLSELPSDALLAIIQKIVVAQQEKQMATVNADTPQAGTSMQQQQPQV